MSGTYARRHLHRRKDTTLETPDGRIAQRTAIAAGQHTILSALGVREPGLIIDYQLPEPADT